MGNRVSLPFSTFLKNPALSRAFVCGFGFWGVLVFFRMVPQGLIFIHIVFGVAAAFAAGVWAHRQLGGRWHGKEWPPICALGYVGIALAFNYNVLFFFLLTPRYYPYPAPNNPGLRVFLLLSAVAAYLSLYFFQGGRAAGLLEKSDRPRTDMALGFLGFGLGNLLANGVVSFSWPLAFFLSLFLFALVIAQTRRGVIVCAILILASAGLYLKQPYLVYNGSLQDDVLETRVDSPYVRSRFYSFNGGSCISITGNYHSITYDCRDVEQLPRGLSFLFQALVLNRSGYSALVAGRTLGMYPHILLSLNPDARVVQTAEFDPQVMKIVKSRYASLSSGRQDRDKIKYFAGDLSRYILGQHQPYDLIFYNGIGVSQFQIPFCFPYQEQFLFTSRVFMHIFDELLRPDGVLVIDWGGRNVEDSMNLITKLPPDIHFRAFWHVMTEPPFISSPLNFILASRDRETIEKISAHLKRSTFFTDISSAAQNAEFQTPWQQLWFLRKSSWDRPFLLGDMAGVQILILFFAALAVILLSASVLFLLTGGSSCALSLYPALRSALGRRLRLFCFLPFRIKALPWLAGAAASIWFIDTAARQSHQLAGYGYIWPIFAFIWLSAAAFGMSYPFGKTAFFLRTGIFIALSAAAAWLSCADFEGIPALLPVVVSGWLSGHGLQKVMVNQQSEGPMKDIPGFFCGLAGGFVISQVLIFLFGFDWLSVFGSAALVVLFWKLRAISGRALTA